MEGFRIGDLKIKLPIVQGGMGVAISLSGLASAVANSGGIGIISAAAIGMKEQELGTERNSRKANKIALQKEIRKAKSLSNGVIGVNIMMALTDHEDLIKVAIEEDIDLIIMGAGLPIRIPGMLAEAGITNFRTKLAIKVSSAKAARLIFQSWAKKYNRIPDAVVVEGPLAGGHLGFKREEVTGEVVPLKKLVEETVREVAVFDPEIPVIAAGGIYTGKDMFDIMQAGAKAVKLGTRFVTTHECDADIAFKNSYLSCNSADDIVIINSPVGLPGRVVKNEFVEQIYAGKTKPFKCGWNCLSSCNYKEAPYCIADALYKASKGQMDEGFAFCGSNAYKATKIQSVAEVVNELMTEYTAEVNKNIAVEIPHLAVSTSIAS